MLEHVHDAGCVHSIVKTAISVNTRELSGAALEKALAQIQAGTWLCRRERTPHKSRAQIIFKGVVPANGHAAGKSNI
jgi:hypothetical protein